MRGKISPKFHVENGAKNGKSHASFTLLGRSAEKTLCNFEPQIWPEIITSHEMPKVLVLKAQGKGSRTSCDVIILGFV